MGKKYPKVGQIIGIFLSTSYLIDILLTTIHSIRLTTVLSCCSKPNKFKVPRPLPNIAPPVSANLIYITANDTTHELTSDLVSERLKAAVNDSTSLSSCVVDDTCETTSYPAYSTSSQSYVTQAYEEEAGLDELVFTNEDELAIQSLLEM